ncbi:conserved hypothetical protein [Trichinella spiralis]|uniref:hypothetical protein n=1 Tax=Trichinella spiralis TaxID=6334 RepID=UPI0001EFCB19|nr:conserved hypothetical protein [Trichinella spiralis]
MLPATAFLPVPQVDTGVSLLEAGTTGICLDALCHNKNSSPAFVPTMIGLYIVNFTRLKRGKGPDLDGPSAHPPGSFRCDHSACQCHRCHMKAELVFRVTAGLILMNLTVNTFIKALQKSQLDYFLIKRFPYGNDGMFSGAFTITL